MFRVYVAMIQKADKAGADYGVFFPDLPGCVFGGSTYEKALLTAQEGLLFHIEGLIEAGEAVPLPTSLDEVMKDKEYQSCVPALLRILMPMGKPKRLNISLDTGLAAEIDTFAKAHGYNRSEFLAEAARRMMV